MTTTASALNLTRIPEPPRHKPDDMTAVKHLHANGNTHHLIHHLRSRVANPARMIFANERYLIAERGSPARERRIPDLMIAFDAKPELYQDEEAYVIAEQGKPPDFILEVASPSTGHIDIGAKRRHYAELGVPEYWRFDETGEYHHALLAGDVLRPGQEQYEALPIDQLEDGSRQGYSAALSLYLRWTDGGLFFIDPATEMPIESFEQVRRERETARREAAIAQQETATAQQRIAALESEIERLHRQQ